jgi:hypothetical protein
MDPLSISASIAALLQISGTVIDLISAITSSSAETRSLTIEINTTRALLSSIAEIASVDGTWNQNLRRLTIQDGPVQMLDSLLSKLEHRLSREVETKGGLRQLKRKIIWPWRVDETRQMVRTAREARGLLAGALAMDHL